MRMNQAKRIRRRVGALAVLLVIMQAGAVRGQDLDGLVRELLEKNPAVLAARRAVDARRARVTPARTLPDPSVSFESMGKLLPPTLMEGDSSSARVLTFSQEIPFPGKLNLQGQIAAAEADAEMWKYEGVRREAVAELKMAYYDYFLARKLTGVVEKSKQLLAQFADVSEARYKVGEGAQQDVIKAQVEVSRLLDRLATLRRDQDAALVRINTLLLRAPDTPVGDIPDLPKPPAIPNLDELYHKAAGNNPLAQMGRKEIESGELGVSLAKKSFYPDFEVGFSYFNRIDQPQMFGVMLKAKIPLYFWRRQRPELESAASGLIARKHEYDDTLASLYFRLKEPYLRTVTDSGLLELYSGAIIPQANLALESSISSYRVGKVDFLSLLSNQQTLLEYQMKYNEVLVDCYKALAAIEALTGEVVKP